MKTRAYIVIICLFQIGCTSNRIDSDNEPIQNESNPTSSFKNWDDALPSLMYRLDTLSSKDNLSVNSSIGKEYLSKTNIVGKIMTLSGESGYHTFLVTSMNNGNSKLNIEVYDSLGNLEFSRNLFDYKLIEEPSTFSRFYGYDKWFIFENYTEKKGNEIIINRDSVEIYSMIK